MLYGKGKISADLRQSAQAIVDAVMGGIQTTQAQPLATDEVLRRLDHAAGRLEAAARHWGQGDGHGAR
jgi:hypothetical protein